MSEHTSLTEDAEYDQDEEERACAVALPKFALKSHLCLGEVRRTPPSVLSLVRDPEKEHWLTGVLKIYDVLVGLMSLGQTNYRSTRVWYPQTIHPPTRDAQANSTEKQSQILNPVFSPQICANCAPRFNPSPTSFSVGVWRRYHPSEVSVCVFVPVAAAETSVGAKEVDLHPWMGRGTIEYVGQEVLGNNFGALDPQNSNKYVDAIRNAIRNLSPFWRNKLVDCLPLPPLRQIREMCYTMERYSKKILEEKREAMEQGRASEQRDLMAIMLEANVSTSEVERLTDVELTGQINTMLLGGQETSTSALSRILWILSRDQPAQARLRSEIRAAKLAHAAASGHDGPWESVHLPYDTLMALPYLDAVLRETLRVHPPTNMINRTCTRDAALPVEFPLTDASGEEVKAVWGDDADVWRPERWLTASGERIELTEGRSVDLVLGQAADDGEKSLDGAPGYKAGVKCPGVYATIMTFLGGGRACIGFKFAEMEINSFCRDRASHHDLLVTPPHLSAVDKNGVRKEIYWRIDGLQIPVVGEPHGDFKSPQVPLDVRVVIDSDYL
ncbi:cytochrome P450 [Epithele typhae]|uniref:cytochrome P450 n=1 Tax=Epithele typhae TaxID=378194 RepID=UPI0020073AF2|nr:cytochrome P450 [Epithele typhae]KAH9941732.1 cytochrome P450 [Epithele typhae]